MSLLLHRFRVLASVYYAMMVEYRAEIVLWVFAGMLPFLMMGLWTQAEGPYPLSRAEFARYFFAVFVIRQSTIVWVIWDFEYFVVEGRLSPLLLQPMDPVWRFVMAHMTEQVTRLPFWGLLIGLFFLLYPYAFWIPRPGHALLALAAIMLAFTLRFALQYTLAMLSFWIERASALELAAYIPFLFLSGMIAPLEVYPPAVRAFAAYTPYPYLIDFPAHLLTGQPVNVGRGFAVVAAWTAVFLLLNRVMWRIGLRRYSGMGA